MKTRADQSHGPRVWAVGGGKGGVGKTVVSSSLAIALARSGNRCIACDADFGAANLHTLLGVPEPPRLLRQFVSGEFGSLEEVAVETPIPKLKLVSGARAAINAANLDHPRRQKLIRHIRKLDADDVVIDLGAGSSFNALDFFVSADLSLAVVSPEPTSIENAYHFMKAAWFRAMQPATAVRRVREAVVLAIGDHRGRIAIPPRRLLEAVSQVDPYAAEQLSKRAEAFRPGLVVNRVASSCELQLDERIAEGCQEAIGANVRPVGSLSLDDVVPRALEQGKAVLEAFPCSRFGDEIYALAERMLASPALPIGIGTRRPPVQRIREALRLDRRYEAKQEAIRQMAAIAALD